MKNCPIPKPRFILQLALVLLCSGTSFAQVTIPFFRPGTIRVLILSGRNNHDWRTTTPFLRKTLVDSGRFDVRVEEEPMGITQATLAAYDVLVLDYDGPRWGEVTEKAVESFVNSGKGLVGIHAASYAFSGLEVLGDNHRPWDSKSRLAGLFDDARWPVDRRAAQDRTCAPALLHREIRGPRAPDRQRHEGLVCGLGRALPQPPDVAPSSRPGDRFR